MDRRRNDSSYVRLELYRNKHILLTDNKEIQQ